ncbi:MAG: 2-C-methyl-D-erythritol 2,4-cyclodiphosphate synthase, partial [Clostridia bacterium]|nr:2-C-methyl-D-erythritol 2,4-cyclodiphosphate synthase [Clostridia bacterium]
RIGHGYDVHKLVSDRRLVLGGVDIEHEVGLLGHSDADVLLHAIMDAILGAMGEGDIGKHFPDSDEKYRGISSISLLSDVFSLMNNRGFSIVNVDATVIAQRPKLSPHIDKMRQNIAFVLNTEKERVNVKATTEEHLGFTGREEGISAHAVVLLEKK